MCEDFEIHGVTKECLGVAQAADVAHCEAHLDICVASANVNKASGEGTDKNLKGKDEHLRAQFHQEGLHVVGIQEGDATKAAQLESANYVRIIAGPHGAKRGDVELWMNCSIP